MKVLSLAAALLLWSAAARAVDKLNGFNMPCWSGDCYAWPNTRESLKRMAQTGAGWVALTPNWYMRSETDSTIIAENGTSSDDALRAAIRSAKASGLHVALKPHVDVENNRFRSLIHPSDSKAWFKSYRRSRRPRPQDQATRIPLVSRRGWLLAQESQGKAQT